MKLSTRGRYALRMMLDIALHPDESSVSLKSIAQRQGISVKYLEQIVTPLVRGNYLRASPRRAGRLSAQPSRWRIHSRHDPPDHRGQSCPVACLEDGDCICERQELCVTVEVYRKIDDAIDAVVDNITLADLVEMQRRKWGGEMPPEPVTP